MQAVSSFSLLQSTHLKMKPDTRFLVFAFTVTFVLVSLTASTVTAIPFDALILQSPTVSGTGIDHPPRADIDILIKRKETTTVG
jgi:hypothetical protein